jgi:hypothetical protein
MTLQAAPTSKLQADAGPIRNLTCSCCGNSTRGRQWHDRDTGYGLCVACIDYCSRGESPESMRACYGDRGVHYEVIESKDAA